MPVIARGPGRFGRHTSRQGFSLLELMIVIAIIAILALIALPGLPDKAVRDQVIDSVKIADIAKAPIAAQWAQTGKMPTNNTEAGLPQADHVVSNTVTSVSVESGAIQVTFGNQAYVGIRGKTLTLRPGVVDDAIIVPVAWICGNADAPPNMTAHGLNKTNLPTRFLPLNCRGNNKAVSVG